MSGHATVWVGIAAIVIAPLVSYLAASRRLSGKIATSDADALWTESRSIREDYRARLDAGNKRIAELEARVAEVEKLNNSLTSKNSLLERETERLNNEIARLNDVIGQLRADGMKP